eukprot:CAMPEP_0206267526 /NCGR_PEP_ID=MMETSP0047_2-20121206/31199_1 /ASSEMBLY_ACC=CAM_ASM_000192 /TAXON_ID=195065 /ORGANISM="Chroomonas mesostigmatica_cf, Strain CCMP1168" /LENGTH=45 /DNA_ID= /DNA_START= /DNA_END= /DNA_ORIENTATION=
MTSCFPSYAATYFLTSLSSAALASTERFAIQEVGGKECTLLLGQL